MNADTELPVPESELEERFIHASGPGGQNVNKVASAVQLRFDAASSPSLSDYQRRQLRRVASHLMSKDGVITIEASRHRNQGKNRADARARLGELIAQASRPPPKPRRKTRPTRASVERRLKKKAGRGRIKALRGKVPDE